MAEEPPIGGSAPQIDPKAVSNLVEKTDASAKTLVNLAQTAKETENKIEAVLKEEKKVVAGLKEVSDNVAESVEQQKKAAAAAAEAARESKDDSSSKAEKLADNLRKQHAENNKTLTDIYKNSLPKIVTGGFSNALVSVMKAGGGTKVGGMLGTGIAATTGFALGAIPAVFKTYTLFFQTVFRGLANVLDLGLINLRRIFGTSIPRLGQIPQMIGNVVDLFLIQLRRLPLIGDLVPRLRDVLAGGLFPDIIKLFKSFGNLIDLGLINLRKLPALGRFVPRLRDIFNPILDFGKWIRTFFSGDGLLYGTMRVIEKFFGEGALNVFVKAFDMGAKIGKYIPLLSIVPTAIETIVAAFSKFKTEGFRGVFKAIMVGLLKGVAAFFTFGISDLGLSFEKMYESFSASLDGIIDQVEGFVNLFVDIFKWIFDYGVRIWQNILMPILMSLWNDALMPILAAFSAVGDFAMSLANVALGILKPVLSISKFIFKMMFEIVKLLWEFVVYPILWVLVPVFKLLFKIIGVVMTPIVWIFQGLAWMVNGIWNNFLKPIMDWITELFDAGSEMGSLSDLIRNAISYWVDGLMTIINGIVWFVSSSWDGMTSELARLFLWLWEKITAAWEPVKMWLGECLEGLLYIFEGVVAIIEGIVWFVSNSWDGMTSELARLFLWLWDKITTTWEDVKMWLSECLEGLLYVFELFSEGMAYLGEVIDFAYNKVLDGVDWAMNTLENIFYYIGDLWKSGVNFVKNWWSDTLDGIEALFEFCTGLFFLGIDFVKKQWDMSIKAVKAWFNFWTGLFTMGMDYIGGLWDQTLGVAGLMFDYIGQLWNEFWTDIGDGISYIQESIESGFNSLMEWIDPVLDPIYSFFDWLGTTFETIKDYAHSLISWIPGMGGDETPDAKKVKEASTEALPKTANEAVDSEMDRLNSKVLFAEKRLQELKDQGRTETKAFEVWERNSESWGNDSKRLRGEVMSGESPEAIAKRRGLQYQGMESGKPEIVSKPEFKRDILAERRAERAAEKAKWEKIRERELRELYGGDVDAMNAANMATLERMKGGAAGGAGISTRRAETAPVIINNTAATTNNVSGGGGGGGIPVPLAPNPVHHMDPTRGLIST
jgi:phage-related protein